MNTDRRGFFASMLGVLAAPKQLVLRPFRKRTSQSLLTLQMLRALERNLALKTHQEALFCSPVSKIGDTLYVRKPARFVASQEKA
jgi:hypothetical protein